MVETRTTPSQGRVVSRLFAWVVLAAVAGGVWFLWPTLTARIRQMVRPAATPGATGHDAHDAHGGHEQGGQTHAHDETTSLELSDQARRNLGLTREFVRPVQMQTFTRTITVPAVVAERPGRTITHVATPLTGVIEHVHAVTGEAVETGSLLFEIRLTHEDLVQTQTEFLRTLGELDVETREMRRLNDVAKSGAIAGKALLDREYSKEKLEVLLKAQREALRLHGISDRQIEEIVENRHLLRELQILVPSPDVHGAHEELRLTRIPVRPVSQHQEADASKPLFVIEQLNAPKGKSVAAGEPLCGLADYSRLYIEGKAFEQDAAALSRALKNNWTVTANFPDEQHPIAVPGLKLAFIANSIDPVSRSLSFYVDLANEIVRDETNAEGQRFMSWKYRLGQRLELQIPTEEWPEQLVIPVDAIARDGAEAYVFQENGDHFDRVAVHVKYQDQHFAVIDRDGAVFPGDVIAWRSAHQLQMALKNKSGGGVDPHAGHHH